MFYAISDESFISKINTSIDIDLILFLAIFKQTNFDSFKCRAAQTRCKDFECGYIRSLA